MNKEKALDDIIEIDRQIQRLVTKRCNIVTMYNRQNPSDYIAHKYNYQPKTAPNTATITFMKPIRIKSRG